MLATSASFTEMAHILRSRERVHYLGFGPDAASAIALILCSITVSLSSTVLPHSAESSTRDARSSIVCGGSGGPCLSFRLVQSANAGYFFLR